MNRRADAALAEALLDVWFADALESTHAAKARCKIWFRHDTSFDEALAQSFGTLPQRALAGELDTWGELPRYALARIIALDQLPRNLYRDSARGFAFDPAALLAAKDAVARGHDAMLHPLEALFVYLPFEHAEDLAMQVRSVTLIENLQARAPRGLEPVFAGFADYARRHQQVIARFGRFPHRNGVLGREPTPEEIDYLGQGGERFGAARR